MGDLDLVTKILMRLAPEAFVHLGLGSDVTLREFRGADKELEALSVVMDKLYELCLDDDPDPHYLHVEVAARWQHDLPYRMTDYRWLGRRTVDGPITSLLICLKPGAKQGAPTDRYTERTPRSELTFRYALVCAWEWTVTELLSGSPALIPFVPFAGDASAERIDEAIAAASRADPRLRAELLGALAVFAGNVFKDVDWSARMPKELLMENTIYKRGEAAGVEKGTLIGERRMVALLLEAKLERDAATFLSRLEACTETQLETLGRLLVKDQPQADLIAALEQLLAGS